MLPHAHRFWLGSGTSQNYHPDLHILPILLQVTRRTWGSSKGPTYQHICMLRLSSDIALIHWQLQLPLHWEKERTKELLVLNVKTLLCPQALSFQQSIFLPGSSALSFLLTFQHLQFLAFLPNLEIPHPTIPSESAASETRSGLLTFIQITFLTVITSQREKKSSFLVKLKYVQTLSHWCLLLSNLKAFS